MIIGIVAEGKADFLVLKCYIKKWASNARPKEEIVFRPFQPTVDASSGKWGKGGWTLVKIWCENNSPKSRQNQIFRPLFRHEKGCDALVIQLDADIVGTMVDATPGVAPPAAFDKARRATTVNAIIETWLWPENAQKTDSFSYDCHLKLPSVRALEAWLIAGLDPGIQDPEEVNPKDELLRLLPDLEIIENGKIQLKKSGRKWAQLAEETADRLDHICDKCDQLKYFFDGLDGM